MTPTKPASCFNIEAILEVCAEGVLKYEPMSCIVPADNANDAIRKLKVLYPGLCEIKAVTPFIQTGVFE